ncbi:MAG: hypothetical protein OXH09_13280, partial [Gammaproteobacteria bacterium]|nr:hypothetical protein [Gammaproteobacteria bacterium]
MAGQRFGFTAVPCTGDRCLSHHEPLGTLICMLAGQSHLKSLDLLGGSHHVEEEVVVPSGALDLAA